MVHVIAFTGSFTDTRHNGTSAVLNGNVVNQFLHQDGFADTGTAEQTDLTALGIRAQQVDDLDACFQDFAGCLLLGKGRSLSVNRHVFACLDFTESVNRFTENVEHSSENLIADRNLNRRTCIHAIHSSDKTVSGTHRDTADNVITDVLSNLGCHGDACFAVLDLDCIFNGR